MKTPFDIPISKPGKTSKGSGAKKRGGATVSTADPLANLWQSARDETVKDQVIKSRSSSVDSDVIMDSPNKQAGKIGTNIESESTEEDMDYGQSDSPTF